jgi:hypothetical protein
MLLVAYRHGFRAAELVDLRWDQVDFDGHRLHVRRAKKGNPSTDLLQGDEMRALRKLRRESPHSDFVFLSLSLEADRMSAITARSPETDANGTLENVTLTDGVPTRNGLPVLDEAPSNTDHGVAGQPAEPRTGLVNKYLTSNGGPPPLPGWQ